MLRPGWENAFESAELRSRVDELVTSNWSQALKLANEIPHRWYRVQSLAKVAMAAPDDQFDTVLDTARSEASQDADAYRRVAVLAWIIDAALARGRSSTADAILRDAMSTIGTVIPDKSRAAALELLLARAIRIGDPHLRQVADALSEVAAILAADPYKKWRKWGKTYAKRIVWLLGRNHHPLAEQLLTARFGAARAAAFLNPRHPFPYR
ncbi:MAG: hypothetical protein GC200_11175 [Tepidisphaera sp.]|nr:hypothetical protein [Tepidisphaera sp.]